MEIVISNSKLNSYGFRVLTEGIDLTQYRRNPVVLWNHSRAWRGTTDEVLPVGRMENLRVEGDNLVGTPVFDTKDKFAAEIARKFADGFLKMCSAGLDVVEVSSDASVIVQGQTHSTVTKSRLREVSMVDIGANDDALVLYAGDRVVNLKAGGDLSLSVPEIEFKNDLKDNEISMKSIALKLGLPETAPESDVLAAVGKLQATAQTVVELQKKIDGQISAAIAAEVDSAIKLKRITADKREHFVSLGNSAGIDALRTTLELMQPAVKPTDITGKGGHAGDGVKAFKNLNDAERIRLRSEDPEKYRELFKAEYGIEFND